VRDRLGIEHAVLQAALGGGIAGPELAAAVSLAGGLGSLGIVLSPERYRAAIRRARERAPGKPIGANLLFPVMRRAHVRVCVEERVPVVSLFFGFDRRVVEALHGAGCTVLHQVGTLDQARRALACGADALIVQGDGAGGHVLAGESLETLLPRVRQVAGDRPVLAAGGIHDRASAAAALALGASGVWVGTRFLLTHESAAHDAYKQRLLAADSTLVTLLFGLGWHGLHRVVPNAATQRWCAGEVLGPSWVRAFNRTTAPLMSRLPLTAVGRALMAQRVAVPLYSPAALLRGMDERLIDVTPLYAGRCVGRIDALRSAAEVVRELAS
jgi:NAD(P)H-dependent flavin oxidoreductase YrpB (nitropropane dioxygenase family)